MLSAESTRHHLFLSVYPLEEGFFGKKVPVVWPHFLGPGARYSIGLEEGLFPGFAYRSHPTAVLLSVPHGGLQWNAFVYS